MNQTALLKLVVPVLPADGWREAEPRVVAEAARLLDALEDVVDGVGDVGAQQLLALGRVVLHRLARAVEHRGDRPRRAVAATTRERRVDACHRQRVDVGHAERERPDDVGVRDDDAHLLGQRGGRAEAGALLELGEEGVHRQLGARVEVERAAAGGVLRAPGARAAEVAVAGAVAALRDRDRLRRVDARRQRDALGDRGGQHERLERRPGLEAASVAVLSRHDVVEVGLALPLVAAHRARLRQGAHLAGARLHRREPADGLVRRMDVASHRASAARW